MRGLRGKVIVLAGGATGLGAATAHRLAQEGATVMIGDINKAGARETADAIIDGGGSALGVGFNIADEQSCANLMARAGEVYGGSDGLFNVAADLSEDTLGRDSDVVSVPVQVWQRSLGVNLTGYFYTCRHAVPRMLHRGGGRS